jgi:hypothetical protein
MMVIRKYVDVVLKGRRRAGTPCVGRHRVGSWSRSEERKRRVAGSCLGDAEEGAGSHQQEEGEAVDLFCRSV